MRGLYSTAAILLAATAVASAAGIDLGTYTARSPRIELGATVAQDASGLAYNASTGTLFVVRNNGPERIFEIDTSGNVLRSIGLTGFDDTEGIAHLGGTDFAVTEERLDQIVTFSIGPGPSVTIDHGTANVFTFSAGSGLDPAADNNGLEGLSFDASSGLFVMVQEKSPLGFFQFALPGSGSVISATSPFNLDDTPTYGITDAAGVTHLPSGNVLVLSDESETILEIEPTSGNLIGSLDLTSIHPGPVPGNYQPEGIAFNPTNGDIYVLTEPSAFYVLSNPSFTPIPEPARTLSGGIALFAALAAHRRRRTVSR